jgi:hypothetical protein
MIRVRVPKKRMRAGTNTANQGADSVLHGTQRVLNGYSGCPTGTAGTQRVLNGCSAGRAGSSTSLTLGRRESFSSTSAQTSARSRGRCWTFGLRRACACSWRPPVRKVARRRVVCCLPNVVWRRAACCALHGVWCTLHAPPLMRMLTGMLREAAPRCVPHVS